MFECYKIPMAVVITSAPQNIIGASLFVVETMNVDLTGIHGKDKDGVEERQARLNAEASVNSFEAKCVSFEFLYIGRISLQFV